MAIRIPAASAGNAATLKGRGARLRARAIWAAQALTLSLASAGAVLVGGEWLLRRCLPFEGFTYRLDPRYLYTLAPNTRAVFRHGPQNGGGMILVTVNSDGFRGDELRQDGEPRIVVYGDSCVEADYSRLAETFTRRLEVRLGAALSRAVETVNAGVNGYGPDQSLRRFEDEVRWLHPRGVIFTVFADNDFGDLVRNRLYRLEAGRLVEAGGVLVPPARQLFEPSHRNRGPELWRRLQVLLRRARRRRRIAPEARASARQGGLSNQLPLSIELCRREYEEAVTKRNRLISDLVKDHYDADVSLFPDSKSAVYKRVLLEAVLRRARATAEEAGVRALALIVPSAIDACDRHDVRIDPRLYPAYERSRLSSEAAGAARRAGLAVVNLFDAFRDAGADRLYYHGSEDHWNAAGQDLAARLVTEELVKECWLGP